MLFNKVDEAVAVDVETTGLDPNNDRIISGTAVKVHLNDIEESMKLGKKNYTFPGYEPEIKVNSQTRISRKVFNTNGCTIRAVK